MWTAQRLSLSPSLQGFKNSYRSLLVYFRSLPPHQKECKFSEAHTYETRHKNKFEVSPHRTCRYELKPSYQGIKFYEALPNIIRMEENFIKFKSSLKKYLIDKSYYKVNELFE